MLTLKFECMNDNTCNVYHFFKNKNKNKELKAWIVIHAMFTIKIDKKKKKKKTKNKSWKFECMNINTCNVLNG